MATKPLPHPGLGPALQPADRVDATDRRVTAGRMPDEEECDNLGDDAEGVIKAVRWKIVQLRWLLRCVNTTLDFIAKEPALNSHALEFLRIQTRMVSPRLARRPGVGSVPTGHDAKATLLGGSARLQQLVCSCALAVAASWIERFEAREWCS